MASPVVTATVTTTTFAVQITLSHATELAASDLNGKSDPYVSFSIDGQQKRSSCRPATCDPIWTPQEQFDFKVCDPERKCLQVQVFDHDLISQDDLLGSVEIPLHDFLNQDADLTIKTGSREQPFALQVPPEFHRQQLRSLLYLSVRLMPLDQVDCIQEMWENEYWVLGKRWAASSSGGGGGFGVGSLLHHRAQWSLEDGRVSSSHFKTIAPKTPTGFVSDGWGFTVGRGDPEGWYYATTFAGPWYNAQNFTTTVRRRKWVSVCRHVSQTVKKADGSPRATEVLPTPINKSMQAMDC